MAMLTRSKNPHNGTILDLGPRVRSPRQQHRQPINKTPEVALPRASRQLVAPPDTAPQDDKISYFRKVFKDPPNAATLMNRVLPIGQPQPDVPVDNGGGDTTRFRILQFNNSGTNAEHIFRAAFYLRSALRARAHLEDEKFVFARSLFGVEFCAMAEELGTIEPTLRGVTPKALHSLHERLVKERTALDAFERTATGDKWKGTQLATIAEDIAHIDRMIRGREARQRGVRSDEGTARMALEALTRAHASMRNTTLKRDAHVALLDVEETKGDRPSDVEETEGDRQSDVAETEGDWQSNVEETEGDRQADVDLVDTEPNDEESAVQLLSDMAAPIMPAPPAAATSDQGSLSTHPQFYGAATRTVLPMGQPGAPSDISDSSVASSRIDSRILMPTTKRRAIAMSPDQCEQITALQNQVSVMERQIQFLLNYVEENTSAMRSFEDRFASVHTLVDDNQLSAVRSIQHLRADLERRTRRY
ncbi:hypothetical protein DFQ26_004418 [Actinomortierella ambigua]|nr:hypothetical protein DFQ26_004418 [Actinomortierella ambigua]